MTASAAITVLLPTYNPRMDHIERVLEGLHRQTLPSTEWDLLVIDNNSNPPLAGRLDLSWHARASIVVEPTPGKMHALANAFRLTSTPLLLILDDDTVPNADLIEQTLVIAGKFPVLGTWSTRVKLEIEDPRHPPHDRLRSLLAERLIDEPMWSNDPLHTPSTAWGCGMTVRRAVADAYLRQTVDNPSRLQLDPVGDQPGYGGDTDLSYTGCSIGLGMGVFPQLEITHLIPVRRCGLDYLLRNLEAHVFSHHMQHFAHHNELPPAFGLGTRLRTHWRWLTGDAVDRAMMAAESRGREAARRAIATGIDGRPVTHR